MAHRVRDLVATIDQNRLITAVGIAILVRVLLFAVIAVHPITDEHGDQVSPVHYSGTDLSYYQSYRRNLYFPEGGQEQRWEFIRGQLTHHTMLAPPLYPVLLQIFDYRPGNTLPMAIFFLAIGVVTVTMWTRWLQQQGLTLFWLVSFALMPAPLWYMLNVGTDLLYAFLFGLFFLAYFKDKRNRIDNIVLVASVILLVLCRPTSVTLIGFIAVYEFYRLIVADKGKLKFIFMGVFLILAIPVLLFYFPYVSKFLSNSTNFEFFGLYPHEYYAGIFEFLPKFIDLPLSWLSYIFAKILYFIGLRPSYSGIEFWKLAIRFAPGMLLLPGLLFALWRGDVRMRMLLAFFLFPMLIGVSQDRYNLPILPILFFYGALFYNDLATRIWSRLRPRRMVR